MTLTLKRFRQIFPGISDHENIIEYIEVNKELDEKQLLARNQSDESINYYGTYKRMLKLHFYKCRY